MKSRIFLIIKVVVVLFFFTTPYFMAFFSAHIMTTDLKPKPMIIGHRGAVELAPENTISGYQTAIQLGVYAIEIDVRITEDGIPFIMHDETLFRTTNVLDVFPNRTNEASESFILSEIQKLDAGSWFSSNFKGEKVPLLKDVLDLVNRSSNKEVKIFFDLKWPPKTHPFASSYLDIVRMEIKKYDSMEDRIIFPVYNESYIPVFRNETPKVILAAQYMFNLSEMIANNLTYKIYQYDLPDRDTRDYLEKVKVIVWTINSDWLFDQLWCVGVSYIITNKVVELLNRSSPMYITQANYLLLTICVEVFVLLLLLAIFAKDRKKKDSELSFLSSTEQRSGEVMNV